jgi:catechol 2,3-dioxygenase-like lactoylglutathione lyase family enzyme
MLAIQRCEKEPAMITGSHVILTSKDPDADRAFFRDVLNFPFVDAGHGWLIFALPPAEAAFHPSEKNDLHELYFMCDDLKATMESLRAKKVKCGEVKEERWGSLTTIVLPGGGKIGLYQPKHPTAIGR